MTRQDVRAVFRRLEMRAARDLGFIEPQASYDDLRRALRGRGGKRRMLREIVRSYGTPGVNAAGIVNRVNLEVCKQWVDHLREEGFAALGEKELAVHFRKHLDVSLHPYVKAELREGNEQDKRDRLNEALKEIRAQLGSRKRRALAIDVLAKLVIREPKSVEKQLERERSAARRASKRAERQTLNGWDDPREVPLPVAPGAGGIRLDIELLYQRRDEFKRAQGRHRKRS